MRQIEAISAMLTYLLSGEKKHITTVHEETQTLADPNRLYRDLRLLTDQGRICEAENLLFAEMDGYNPEVPEAAIQFYSDINTFSDQALEAHNFSRDEIFSGLKEICARYHLDFF